LRSAMQTAASHVGTRPTSSLLVGSSYHDLRQFNSHVTCHFYRAMCTASVDKKLFGCRVDLLAPARKLNAESAAPYTAAEFRYHSAAQRHAAEVLFIYEMRRTAAVIWQDNFDELQASEMFYCVCAPDRGWSRVTRCLHAR